MRTRREGSNSLCCSVLNDAENSPLASSNFKRNSLARARLKSIASSSLCGCACILDESTIRRVYDSLKGRGDQE